MLKIFTKHAYFSSVGYLITAIIISLSVRLLAKLFFTEEISNFIGKVFLIVIPLFFITRFRYTIIKMDFRELKSDVSYHLVLFVLLLLLFALNNVFMIMNNFKIDYEMGIESRWNIMTLYVSSIVEEFLYRGLIQNNINNLTANNRLISNGNLFASALMALTHFGFFTIMPNLFAITSILLVFIFSLYAGFLFDRYKNIIIPIFVHVSVNSIHLYIHSL